MNRSAKMLVAVLCGALLWSSGGGGSTARASVLTKLSLADMTARAEHVPVGTSRAHRSPSSCKVTVGLIITEVQVRCQRSILGAKEGSLITVRHLVVSSVS